MAEAFLNDYQAKSGCSNNRINDVKSALQGLWTVAGELNLLEGNPFKGIPKKRNDSISKQIFTHEQMEYILKESEKDPDLRTVILLGISTGMRLSDCCTLEWLSINFKERTVAVRCLKKNQGRTGIPFFGILEDLLLNARQTAADHDFVFPRIQQLYKEDPQYFSRAFTSLLLRVGFTNDDNPETSIRISTSDGCRRRPIRSFHGLRTTWMTMALNGGISVETLKKICGSADVEVIIEHYFRTEDNMVRSKLKASMPRFIGGEGMKDGRVAIATDHLLAMVNQLDGSNWEFIRQQLLEEIYQLRRAS